MTSDGNALRARALPRERRALQATIAVVMARLLYVWDADYPWDVRTEKICLSLTRAGHEVHIAARNRTWRPSCEDFPEGRVHRLPNWRWAGKRADGVLSFPVFISPRWFLHLHRIIRANHIDLIITRDLPLCATSVWAGRKARIPVVFDMAENYPALLQDVWDTGRQRSFDWIVRNPRAAAAVERYCLPRVQEVLVVIEEAGEHALRLGAPPGHVSVVSNTPALARLRRPRDMKGNEPVRPLRVVYMGLMEIARGVEVLLEANALIQRRMPRPQLQLIGGGRDLSLLRHQAERLAMSSEEVVFYGYIPSYAEALRIVGEADIGIVPHFANDWANTTIPNKLFDFMAAGLPVVTSESVPCARIVRQTGAGLVFRDRDASNLADILMSLRDPKERQRMALAGGRAVEARYHWEYDEGVLLSVIERALRASGYVGV